MSHQAATQAPSPPGRWRTGGQAVLLLRERAWAAALLGVVLASFLFVHLGEWQYGRHEGKLERRARVEANYDAAPTALEAVLGDPATPLATADQWRPVRLRGHYEAARTVLVRNRPLDGNAGYEVLVPLRLDTGALLIVDRGWLPAGQTAEGPRTVPQPPVGPVTVEVRLRPGEPGLSRRAPPGQALRIELPRLAESIGSPTYRAYGVLAAESPAPAEAPVRLPRPDVGLGPHLAYAFQWWGFAVAAYAIWAVAAFREASRRNGRGAARAALRTAARGPEAVEEDW